MLPAEQSHFLSSLVPPAIGEGWGREGKKSRNPPTVYLPTSCDDDRGNDDDDSLYLFFLSQAFYKDDLT